MLKSVGKNILIFMIVIWFILAIYTFILYWNNYILPTDLIPLNYLKLQWLQYLIYLS